MASFCPCATMSPNLGRAPGLRKQCGRRNPCVQDVDEQRIFGRSGRSARRGPDSRGRIARDGWPRRGLTLIGDGLPLLVVGSLVAASDAISGAWATVAILALAATGCCLVCHDALGDRPVWLERPKCEAKVDLEQTLVEIPLAAWSTRSDLESSPDETPSQR